MNQYNNLEFCKHYGIQINRGALVLEPTKLYDCSLKHKRRENGAKKKKSKREREKERETRERDERERRESETRE